MECLLQEEEEDPGSCDQKCSIAKIYINKTEGKGLPSLHVLTLQSISAALQSARHTEPYSHICLWLI